MGSFCQPWWYFFASLLIDSLMVQPTGIKILANEVWGAIRGLETLSQLFWCSPSGSTVSYLLSEIIISDFHHLNINIDAHYFYYYWKNCILDIHQSDFYCRLPQFSSQRPAFRHIAALHLKTQYPCEFGVYMLFLLLHFGKIYWPTINLPLPLSILSFENV